jgi:serine/threonine-protein kinase
VSDYDTITAECERRVGTMPGGKWRLDALIGIGGMAAVYAATHRNGNRAALKILHPDYAGHVEVRARFLREAYIANKVDHPGTVKILDDDVSENGEPYLVMELLAGQSVESRAQRNGGWLKYPEVLDIVEQTLAVLEKAHSVGVVHRDLKPDNLFFTTKGEVKVLDFGIARLHDAASAHRTQTGLMMGTPAYMAPEQALGKWNDVDGRTDLWSVGAILFSLLSGRTVHDGETDNEVFIRAATRPAPSLGRIVPKAPIELVRVVDRALSFERDKRFSDATSMREAIRTLRARLGPATANAPGKVSPAAPGAARPSTVAPNDVKPSAPPPTQTSSIAPKPPEPASIAPRPPVPSTPSPAPPPAPRVSAPPPTLAEPPERPSARAVPPTPSVAPSDSFPETRRSARPPLAERKQETRKQETFDAAYGTDEDLDKMAELFVETERALIARTHYGDLHPETKRRFERAFRACQASLVTAEFGLVWNISPYSFVARDRTLWEPSAPLDRIPYQLFADGVRTLGFVAGLDESEFFELFRLLTLDRASEVAPEDDFVTMLWDASFDHVVHQAIDTYSEGDQAARVKFETDRAEVVSFAQFDSTDQLAESWQSRTATPRGEGIAEKQSRIVAMFSGGGAPTDTESLARAADFAPGAHRDRPIDPSVLRVDDAMRTMLLARLSMETGRISERFVVAVARAFEDGLDVDGGQAVAVPLRFAVDGLAATDPALALELVGALSEEVGKGFPKERAEESRGKLAGGIVSSKMLESVLEGVSGEGEQQGTFARALRTILGYSDATHFAVVMLRIGAVAATDIRDVLIEYLARVGEGREMDMAALFPTADIELGLALVRVLSGMKTKGAREAISGATESPHAVVRIEALGHVEGVSSERLRLELRKLLEDKDAGVRLAALKAMERYGIRVAGPFLALRVRSPDFDSLPVEERRQAFQTLVALAPARAESAALEVVKDRRLVSPDAHEVSRELATELLGRVGVAPETLAALEELKSARLRNSDRVRAAAAIALEVFKKRAESAPVPAPEPRGSPFRRSQ